MKVIKVGAVWCAGCIVMKPIWKDIEGENTWLETEFYDYDIDKEKLKIYNIDGNLPCFIFLDKEWKEIERIQWEFSKGFLLEKIWKYKNL